MDCLTTGVQRSAADDLPTPTSSDRRSAATFSSTILPATENGMPNTDDRVLGLYVNADDGSLIVIEAAVISVNDTSASCQPSGHLQLQREQFGSNFCLYRPARNNTHSPKGTILSIFGSLRKTPRVLSHSRIDCVLSPHRRHNTPGYNPVTDTVRLPDGEMQLPPLKKRRPRLPTRRPPLTNSPAGTLQNAASAHQTTTATPTRASETHASRRKKVHRRAGMGCAQAGGEGC